MHGIYGYQNNITMPLVSLEHVEDLALSEIQVNMKHDPQILRIDSALAYDRGALTPR